MINPWLLSPLLAAWMLAASAHPGSQPEPFASGDPEIGRPIIVRNCVTCHERRFDRDAERIYTRANRRGKTPVHLAEQVRSCNAELGTGYFPEEEQHIAAYLNKHYYRFE